MHGLIMRFFVYLRNPSFFKILKTLKRNENLTLKEIEEIQIKKLKCLLIHAYEKTEYYNKKFKSEGINVYSENILAEYKKIKPISKEDLISYNKQIHTVKKTRFKAKTSGTSGSKLTFYKSEKWDSFNRASIERGYSWHGVSFFDWKIYFWGLRFEKFQKIKTRILDLMIKRVRLFTFNESDVQYLLRYRKKIRIIEGYSSVINQFATYIMDKNIFFPKLRFIKATSETVKDIYKKNVFNTFNLNLSSEYGSAESGIIGFSCPNGFMHINMESVYIEEENGEAIITNLNSHTFPIIKYKQGDYITLKNNSFCSCHFPFPIIQEVIGRVGSSIYGKRKVYPSLLLYNIFKNINSDCNKIIDYKAEQVIKGEIDILLKLEIIKNNQSLMNLIEKQFFQYCKTDLKPNFKAMEVFTEKNRKSVDFISKIEE